MRKFSGWASRSPLAKANRNESGFTLLELVVVIVIFGILFAVAVPIYNVQQRNSIIATVKADVHSNIAVMSPGADKRLYVTQEKFAQFAVATGDNTVGYLVGTDGSIACNQASHAFSSSDVVSYHFLSTDGQIKEGACPTLDTSAYTPGASGTASSGSSTPSATATPTPSSTPVAAPTEPASAGLTQMAGLIFTPTYSPQNNSLNFCYTVKIEVDPNYHHATPNPSYAWEYKFDLSQPPFWGLNPNTSLNSMYGYTQKSYAGNLWTIKGEGWNDQVTYSDPRTIGFCTSSVPTPPLNPSTYKYTMAASSSNNNYWACVDFTVTSALDYPTPWKIRINLDDYFKNVTGTTPQFTNLTSTKVTGNTYDVTGVGWNQYVAKTMQRTYATSICYSPGGKAW